MRSHGSEFINPIPLSCSSGLIIIRLNLLNDHDGEVLHGMSREVEVFRNWLLCPIVPDIRSEVSEMFVQGILCLAHVLWAPFTPPAFNQIDYVLSLAGGKCAHWVGLACSSAFETVSDLDVFTSLTVTAVAWSVFTCDGDSIDSIHDSC